MRMECVVGQMRVARGREADYRRFVDPVFTPSTQNPPSDSEPDAIQQGVVAVNEVGDAAVSDASSTWRALGNVILPLVPAAAEFLQTVTQRLRRSESPRPRQLAAAAATESRTDLAAVTPSGPASVSQGPPT